MSRSIRSRRITVWVAMDRHPDGVRLSLCLAGPNETYKVAPGDRRWLEPGPCPFTDGRSYEWFPATLTIPIRDGQLYVQGDRPALRVIGGRAVDDDA